LGTNHCLFCNYSSSVDAFEPLWPQQDIERCTTSFLYSVVVVKDVQM